jgi:ABC-type Mn2+/Zn2+ transport system permease subunit
MNLFVRKLTFEDAAEAGRVLVASMMIEPGYVAVLPDEALRQRILVSLITDSVH